MEIARIEVGRTTGHCIRRARIPAGIVGASVRVSFADPVWDNLIKTVVFRGKETRIAEFDGTVAVIPYEVVASEDVTIFFGIYGYDPETDLQLPLIEVRLGSTEAATNVNADPGADPALPIWAQLQQDVEELKQSGGVPGDPGKPGEDGGHYIPAVEQLDEDTIQFSFTPSKTDMPAVEPVTVELPAGQGSGGAAIIDVIELPTNNIREDVFYRLLSGSLVINQLVQNMYTIHCVENLPEIGLPATNIDNPEGNVYYTVSDGEIWGYVDEILSYGLGVPVGWYPGATLLGAVGYGYSGVITNIMDDPKDGAVRLLIEHVVYSYKDSWTSHKSIGWAGTGISSEIFNDPMNIASGTTSHAEGYHSYAEGGTSHAEGWGSHAEGRESHAEGYYSHAEGSSSHAEGDYSHAEGDYSHAEGYHSHAEGYTSHAEGYYSHAVGRCQHVQGEFNLVDPEYNEGTPSVRAKYSHIVGNGTSENNRSNAHTLDWDGNAWFAGDVFVSGNGQDDPKAVRLATMEDLKNSGGNVNSPFSRDLNFGHIPDGYYKWISATREATPDLSSANFLSACDVGWRESGYCVDTNLGNGSAVNKPIWAYDFNPPVVTFDRAKPIPHIIITSALHGSEKGAACGLYYFFHDLVKNWRESPLLTYLRHNVRFTVIPICNRYGWDNDLYYNANGVNLNRNFGYEWDAEDTGSGGTAGNSAFDQPETQIVRNLIAQYPDALCVIDLHTSSREPATAWVNTNLVEFCAVDDPVYEKLYSAVITHFANIKAHFVDDYTLTDTINSTQFGAVEADEPYGGCDWWATSQGIMGMTFEGFAGFVGEETSYSENALHANAELIGNWILTVLRTFAK